MRTHLTALGLLGCLLVLPMGVGAAPPPASTLTTATGTEALSFTWNVAAGATWYYLWVNDDDAAPKFTKWYTAEEAGCVGTQAICSVTVALSWRPGAGRWWIRTNNADGNGPWSAAQNFTIPQHRPFRVMDSSVPAKEVGVVLVDQLMIRTINGVPRVLRMDQNGFQVDSPFTTWHNSNTCGDTPYAGAAFPQRLYVLNAAKTVGFLTNADAAARAFTYNRAYTNGVAGPCLAAAASFPSVSLTSNDPSAALGGFVPPFVILP
jgi:hypothetical protein